MQKRPELDNSYNDEITCPWCGLEFTDSWAYGSCGNSECLRCEKPFSFDSNTTTTYSTSRDCADIDEEHEMELTYTNTKEGTETYICTRCDHMEFKEDQTLMDLEG